jgi:hypothetical protein
LVTGVTGLVNKPEFFPMGPKLGIQGNERLLKTMTVRTVQELLPFPNINAGIMRHSNGRNRQGNSHGASRHTFGLRISKSIQACVWPRIEGTLF